MTPREDLETLAAMHLEVAAYVEKLSGPDREVDAKIAALLGGGWLREGVGVPAYTGSLDAAMRLIPDGFKVHEFEQQGAYEWRWRCWLLRPADAEGMAHAWHPALALTAAALRSRASALTGYGEKGE